MGWGFPSPTSSLLALGLRQPAGLTEGDEAPAGHVASGD